MTFRKGRRGFTVVEVIIAIAIAGVLGLAGFLVANKQQDKNQSAESNQPANQAASSDGPDAPEIKSNEDLDKANSALDATDTNSDPAPLDNELNNL